MQMATSSGGYTLELYTSPQELRRIADELEASGSALLTAHAIDIDEQIEVEVSPELDD